MATQALIDAAIFVAGYDTSGDLNEVGLSVEVDEKEDTCFGDTYRSRIAGLGSADLTGKGFWQSAALNAPDPQAMNNLAVSDRVATVAATTSDLAAAWMLQVNQLKYGLGDKIGEVMPFTLDAKNSSGYGAVRGRLLKPKTTVTGNTNGTGLQLGAVSATQYLYTAIHCFTAGTTADIIVESDDNSGFTSATTRSTTTITAVGGTWVTRVAGAITDDYWRVRTANVTGTFSVAVAVGIR